VIDTADPAETAATIADLVLAAVRDAWDSAVDLQQRQLGALGGGLGGPPAGFDLSSLGLPGLGQPGGLAYDEDEDDEDLDEDEDDEDGLDDEDQAPGAPNDGPGALHQEHKD
jgi:hypothetical protein